jgi:cytochrome c556
MAQGEAATQSLRAALSTTPRNPEAANTAFNQVAQSCTACHKAHRD